MTLEQPVLLPSDVVVLPVAKLRADVRARIECDDGDYAVSRPGLRVPARVISSDAAELLLEFRDPKRIVDGVIAFSRKHGRDPERTLEEAFELLKAFVQSKVLVPAEAGDERIAGSLAAGDEFADLRIVRPVQILDDTEIYEARTRDDRPVALKLVRQANAAAARRSLEREDAVLERLDGKHNPPLVASGELDGRRYLVTGWCAGVPVITAGNRLRWSARPSWREDLHALCLRVLEAYEALERQGVIHGDVHPNNVLVDEANRVTLIDFGIARIADRQSPFHLAHRGGVAFFFDPETAAAMLGPGQPPPVEQIQEQYQLAALLDFVIAGQHYMPVQSERDLLLRQIVEVERLSFRARGFESWPATEGVLGRALSKSAAARYPSLGAFRKALAAAPPPRSTHAPAGLARGADELVAKQIARLHVDAALYREGYPEAPRSSVNLGSGGAAYFLYRLSLLRESSELLAMADAWCIRALEEASRPDAFFNEALDMTPEKLGRASLHHRQPGLHATGALVAHAMGNQAAQGQHTKRFMELSTADDGPFDLTLGPVSALIGTSLLLDLLPAGGPLERQPVVAFAGRVLDAIWRRVDALPPIDACRELPQLGIAHGWAGLLYALLRAHRSSGIEAPDRLRVRLEQLAAFAVPGADPGLVWPGAVKLEGVEIQTLEHAPGWCAGSAGHVHLWTLAHAVCGAERYLELAEGSGRAAFESPEAPSDLCCGLAGRGYALLRLYQHTEDAVWLDRARGLADRLLAEGSGRFLRELSLYRGELGKALFLSECHQAPRDAAMPLFSAEGWPGTPRG